MALSTPDSEPRLFSGPAPGLRLVVLVALAIVLMVFDHRDQHLVHIRGYLAAALYPLQEAVDAPSTAGRWLTENLAARDRLIEENAGLKRELLLAHTEYQHPLPEFVVVMADGQTNGSADRERRILC